MAEYCKVCGIGLKASNTVDYRPGSCRDCELERKKLYSSMSLDVGTGNSRKNKKDKKKKGKISLKKFKKGKKKDLKKLKTLKFRLKKEKLIKAKKLVEKKKLAQIRLEREKKKKKLREKLDRLRKERIKKALKLKLQRRKQKDRERKDREKLKQRIRKARDRERKALQKERERLKREKLKLRQLLKQEKDRVRTEKRADKDRIRLEKQRLKQEKQQEKERLKNAKEAAKLALVQAKEAARHAAYEARRMREDAKKPPMVSVVTKVKEMQPPPDVKIIGASPREQLLRTPQPIKVIDPKKPASVAGATSASLLESATVIPAKANVKEEKEILKQSVTAQHNETIQKEVEKLQKDTDPIIDRYNPYSSGVVIDHNTPRPPSPTPWLAPNFSIVKGDFQEAKQEEGTTSSSGLSEEQVKDIIEKIKTEHKRKST